MQYLLNKYKLYVYWCDELLGKLSNTTFASDDSLSSLSNIIVTTDDILEYFTDDMVKHIIKHANKLIILMPDYYDNEYLNFTIFKYDTREILKKCDIYYTGQKLSLNFLEYLLGTDYKYKINKKCIKKYQKLSNIIEEKIKIQTYEEELLLKLIK